MQSGEPPSMNHEDVDMIDPDDPLLIAQSLTYVTDNGSVLLSYSTAPVTMCTLDSPFLECGIGDVKDLISFIPLYFI